MDIINVLPIITGNTMDEGIPVFLFSDAARMSLQRRVSVGIYNRAPIRMDNDNIVTALHTQPLNSCYR
jgi:hypothetical protein